MDKQELYVATSRSRERTYLCATPEIHAEREEFAPDSIEDRGTLAHLDDAAERDRAQTAAHDEALRDELRQLSAARSSQGGRLWKTPLPQESRSEKATPRSDGPGVAERRYESASTTWNESKATADSGADESYPEPRGRLRPRIRPSLTMRAA
jgi:hypothetical protein